MWVIPFIFFAVSCIEAGQVELPETLQFGVSTSAYQIEGAVAEDGRGPSIWDVYAHKTPSPIQDGSNADIACDSYHKYKEDVALAADLGVSGYRFSFAWPRILPTGYADNINEKGIQYYKNLVNEILKYKMDPVATIFHWDLPQNLVDDGIDLTNPKIIEVGVNYARVLIQRFPEIGQWLTMNEPKQICHLGYGDGSLAPGIVSKGLKEYQCSFNMIKMHAAIYRMYKQEFPNYQAQMSLALDCAWIEPKNTEVKNVLAAERQRQFECGMYFHPIYRGGWPAVVESTIANRSKAANFSTSRLPYMSPEDVAFINGTFDFIGLNHYFTIAASDDRDAPPTEISYEADVGVANSFRRFWTVEQNGMFTIVPYGVRNVLNWIKQQYGDTEIVFTELGMMEDGKSLNDDLRIYFYKEFICNIVAAIQKDKVRVKAIAAWSLMDNWEWANGFEPHFGLYHINFTDPNLTRHPKRSVYFLKELLRTRQIECNEQLVNEIGQGKGSSEKQA